ncbi:GNAT family N-acetyltransferase [Sinomicrobium weinanense]|uniref:GNAT family N-acetyltransferase n=1 Tax=Sinomicrobium weinanense TaxID=2842200 RepID=A0A926JRC0_9FLAO|nr:GNAT family N-acetyltransferase [Sinomicrobium weinanense]MBC9795884.1 GNAT family N-acetyltransferase [Sinomicrobium weinanense]MBU3125404.1 GNAT family N-acetyltransferase [Sinomicrobium weinanense]
MLSIFIKTFDELTTGELYDMLQLRSEVFVVEQDCVYQDIDGKDRKALHLIGKKQGKVVAYTRLFPGGGYFDEASIGRVVVKEEERKYGYGHDIIKASIAAIGDHFKEYRIKISAQKYLIRFYEKHGFVQVGEEYLEDGIPHIGMIRDALNVV